MGYRKFVIISHLRSGTHLLRTLLESHPQITCQSEVFNSDDRALPFGLGTATRDILDQWVYREFDPLIRCAGFVLQAYHPWGLQAFPGIRENPSWADVWDILAAMPELRVIHLRRENLLRRHLSHLMARQTGTWHQWHPERVHRVSHLHPPPSTVTAALERPRITLDARRLQQDFEEVEGLHQRVADRFQGKCYLPVTYEQLNRDPAGTAARLLPFLGLAPATLETAVARLETRPLADSIANFTELKAAFAGTRWSCFFET